MSAGGSGGGGERKTITIAKSVFRVRTSGCWRFVHSVIKLNNAFLHKYFLTCFINSFIETEVSALCDGTGHH